MQSKSLDRDLEKEVQDKLTPAKNELAAKLSELLGLGSGNVITDKCKYLCSGKVVIVASFTPAESSQSIEVRFFIPNKDSLSIPDQLEGHQLKEFLMGRMKGISLKNASISFSMGHRDTSPGILNVEDETIGKLFLDIGGSCDDLARFGIDESTLNTVRVVRQIKAHRTNFGKDSKAASHLLELTKGKGIKTTVTVVENLFDE